MKKLVLLALLSLLLTSCGASKKSTNRIVKNTSTTSVSSKKISKVIQHAKTFEGTRYKFGGADRKGMDCSGLIYVSFRKENIQLPRVSRDMARQGIRLKLNQTKKGDLVFFRTNKNKKAINHVGLVVENKKGVIRFIHSTSSRGVIVSSLTEKYWKNAFVEVRRVI
ncbi:MAG: C40 family peptidase [Flavobacteriaceae bacterium]|nr:C40 family peptidase [Flavobacteriaceae bacterium]